MLCSDTTFELSIRFNLPLMMNPLPSSGKSPKSVGTPGAKAADPVVSKVAKAVKKAATKTPVVPAKKAAAKHSPDVIARAAYLNYRRRVEQGLPGDSRGDWLEAERYVSGKSES